MVRRVTGPRAEVLTDFVDVGTDFGRWPRAGWRWGWDLNPRRLAPHTLSRRAPSAARTRHRRRDYRPRFARKNARSSAPDSSARIPLTTSGRWLSRRSRTTSHSEPAAPAFGSSAP